MAAALRKHVAQRGEKAGQYVDCDAAHCRINGRDGDIPASMFGAAKLWLKEQRGTVTDAQITRNDIDAFLREADPLEYVNRYERENARAHLNQPWSYRSNYEYNLRGLDLAAFMSACDRFNRKNRHAEVTYDVVLKQRNKAARVQVGIGPLVTQMPLNQDEFKLRHVQISGNPDHRELQRLERALTVFVTGKADTAPQLPIFKTPQA